MKPSIATSWRNTDERGAHRLEAASKSSSMSCGGKYLTRAFRETGLDQGLCHQQNRPHLME